MRACAFLVMATAFAVGAARTAAADVIAPDTASLLTEFLAAYPPNAPVPKGVDPTLFHRALDDIRKEMFGHSRPAPASPKLVENYGKALGLDPPSKFLPQIAAVRNAVVRGDDAGVKKAIGQALTAAGKPPPQGDALTQMVDAVDSADTDEPSASQRLQIERPDYTIDVENLRNVGQLQVNVTQPGPDGLPSQTSFNNNVTMTPSANGQTLEPKLTPADPPQTVTSSDAQHLAADLTGQWTDQNGDIWDLALNGTALTATHHRQGKSDQVYRGTYTLGRIEATHVIATRDDMVSGLPDDVKDQIIGRNLTYGLHLHAGDQPDKLPGTWSSQHVTYSGLDHSIESIQDPFDEQMLLSRAGEKVAQGGISPRDGP